MKQGKVDLAVLVARITAAFPDLAFDQATLNDLGEDHVVVVLDQAWVFRFPRNAGAAAYAEGERRLLRQLNRVSPVATPRYERVSAAGDFAGYPMIAGRELNEALFAGLPRAIQERVLDQLGDFLACLHGLPADLIAAPDGSMGPTPRGADYARQYRRRRGRLVSAIPPDLLAALDRFFAALPGAVDRAPKTLIHGDLTEDHILLAPDGDQLGGVIDFTDASLADPAFDFTFLWAYGDWAPVRAAPRYGDGAATAEMVGRSRWWFIRYSVDRLWWNLNGDRACDTAKVIADLRAGLEALAF